MAERFSNLVGGQWVSHQGEWFEDRNPADTSEVVALFPAMREEDVARAVEAARVGFRRWSRTPLYARGAVLRRAALLLRERLEGIARDLTREMGKTLREARGEVARAADFFEYYGAFGRWPEGHILPDGREGVQTWTAREPVGLVAAITPWNDPILTPARKLAPALLAGNAVVLKPASLTPLSAWHLVRALHDAGVVEGAVNMVTGRADVVGQALVKSGEIAAITFTGLTEVGLELLRQAAGRQVRVQNEMGGKNAAVVLRDANLGQAVEAIVAGAFGQSGQRCTATSRVLVESEVYEAFTEAFVARASSLRVGPGLDEATDMGPVVDHRQLENVLRHVALALERGGRLLCGGQRLTGGVWDRGYFVAPTVFADVREDAEVWCQEIFGPVVALMRVSSLDEAIRLVNGTRYGLSAAIFTRDIEAAHRFAGEVDTGCVTVNLPTVGWDVHTPFGGFKDSGSAFKEHGIEGLAFYTRIKTVAMRVRGI